MNQRIVLDDKSFKALSADSRINILKSLKERRKTLSELSQKLELGNSTIKEHCDILVKAELITQIDEGRKWKYYELTKKGKKIVSPNLMEEAKILILLCLGTIVFGGFVLMTLNNPFISNYFYSINSIESTKNYSLNQIGEVSSLVRTTQLGTPSLEEQPHSKTITASGVSELDDYSYQENQILISNEFYAISIILSMIVGIILGWIFLREK